MNLAIRQDAREYLTSETLARAEAAPTPMGYIFMGSKGEGVKGLSGMSMYGVNESVSAGPFTLLRMESADGINQANGQYVSYGLGISPTVFQLGYIKTFSWTEQVGFDASDNKSELKYEGEIFK